MFRRRLVPIPGSTHTSRRTHTDRVPSPLRNRTWYSPSPPNASIDSLIPAAPRSVHRSPVGQR
jgi:hypothetical protein